MRSNYKFLYTPIQNCTITNGSSANTLACHCGSETCNVLTGFICYSTRGGGSCRKTGLGAFGYLRTNVGLCSSRSGRKLGMMAIWGIQRRAGEEIWGDMGEILEYGEISQ